MGSKITADGNYSHEIKRHLLLGRNAMTNLDSILRIRDITLPTKVHLAKAMVFPVIMYGCENLTIGLVRALQPPDILWIHWRVYNSLANTSKQVLFLPPSDAYVIQFLYLLYTLIKLYYTHTKIKLNAKELMLLNCGVGEDS